MSIKRMIKKGLEYDPGFVLPKISQYNAWAICASIGLKDISDVVARVKNYTKKRGPSRNSSDSDQDYDIKDFQFKEKPLSELRSSEPSKEDIMTTQEHEDYLQELQVQERHLQQLREPVTQEID